jgi:4-aminobutyrate aminotransferase
MMARRERMTWPPGSHGSTCGGNPVAIAAALATIRLLENELLANTVRMGARMKKLLEERLAGVPAVAEVRGLGLMIGVEMQTEDQADVVAQGCYQRGLLVLECGDKAIRLSPPLVINEAQVDSATRIFAEACRAASPA